MKRVWKQIGVLGWLLAALLVTGCGAESEVPEVVYQNQLRDRESLELVWSDEFDGEKLNSEYWTYDVGANLWGNHELEYYTKGKNLQLADGQLVITARHESYKGASYTSSRIKTMHKVSFYQGRIEAKIKLPVGQGVWPAFWAMGVDGAWPSCGELDILEAVNACDEIHGYAHWGVPTDDPNGINGAYNVAEGSWTDLADPQEWHVYALEWDSEEIRWYVDDNCFYTFDYDAEKEGQYVFEKPFYLILNIAVGGDWPEYAEPWVFPQSMYVDYVRVYQSKQAD